MIHTSVVRDCTKRDIVRICSRNKRWSIWQRKSVYELSKDRIIVIKICEYKMRYNSRDWIAKLSRQGFEQRIGCVHLFEEGTTQLTKPIIARRCLYSLPKKVAAAMPMKMVPTAANSCFPDMRYSILRIQLRSIEHILISTCTTIQALMSCWMSWAVKERDVKVNPFFFPKMHTEPG